MKVNEYFTGAVLVILMSCGGSGADQIKDSVQTARDSNQAKMDSGMTKNDSSSRMAASVSDADIKFAASATDAGMTEVQLGNVAQQNAAAETVKKFGLMMIKDHTASGKELAKIAVTKNITLPTTVSNDSQQKINDLKQKKGKDFDKAYMSMMVSGHEKVATLFDSEVKDGSDADLRAFATKTLDVIHTHLKQARKCEAAVDQ